MTRRLISPNWFWLSLFELPVQSSVSRQTVISRNLECCLISQTNIQPLCALDQLPSNEICAAAAHRELSSSLPGSRARANLALEFLPAPPSVPGRPRTAHLSVRTAQLRSRRGKKQKSGNVVRYRCCALPMQICGLRVLLRASGLSRHEADSSAVCLGTSA